MRAVTSRNATSSRDGVRHYIEMRVVGPHHDRAQAQSRCVTVSMSPTFMNTMCDRVSPLLRAPHPEREHRLRRRSAGIWFITKAECRCTLSYVSSASIHTPHDRVNPLMQAPIGAHHPPYPATSLANVHIRAYIHANVLISRQTRSRACRLRFYLRQPVRRSC